MNLNAIHHIAIVYICSAGSGFLRFGEITAHIFLN